MMKSCVSAFALVLLTASSAFAQGPIHRWTFDEASGSVALDSGSGTPVNGVLGVGAARVPGVVGTGAVDFVAFDPNGFVDMHPSVSAFGTSDFTISFWVKKRTGPRFGELVGTRGGFGSGGNFVDFRGGDTGVSIEIMENGGGRGYIPIAATVPLADGDWHHVTGVRAGPTAWLYFDDLLVGTRTASDGVTANLIQVFNFTVGANDVMRTFTDLNCGCSFDDVQIYNRALSPFEIMPPAAGIDALASLIDSMGLHHGLANALKAKLNAAQAALADGQDDTAVNILNAFLNLVSAQTDKKLTQAQADQLTAAANTIIGKLQ